MASPRDARIPPARLSHISFHAQTFSLRRGARIPLSPEPHTYHPVLKHSRCAAKLRAGRYVGAQHRGLRCSGSVRPGAVGPGMCVFADNCFAERAAFIAALSLVLGIFVLVEMVLRICW